MRRLKGFRPQYVTEDGCLWASRGYNLYKTTAPARYDLQKGDFVRVGSVDPGLSTTLKNSLRLTSRLFRGGIHGIYPLADGALIAILRGALWKLDPGATQLRPIFAFPRGSRPLNLCVTPDQKLYFGEYFGNTERDAVHIYGSSDGGESWDIVHTFPKGAIRHVHGISYDPIRSCVWVMTGDLDQECQILCTDDHFKTLEPIIQGNQNARTVALIPLEQGLIVPTDTEFAPNFIQYLEPQSGVLTQLQAVPGSVFYAAEAGPYKVIATVVEPSAVNLSRHATIWYSVDGKRWQQLYQQQKDMWHKYFQYGSLQLPAGKNPNSLVFAYGLALRKDDDHMLIWDLEQDRT